ncbi:hypothetical protein Ae406Ps2_0218c [Pseudonocardia sp. Ae406_Ps2]|nr:hypothetical protein Ae406Ps2_0218c [Pseudonocardia sp. Ae406_Ps2]OLM07989.1 hypothetical protein Ae331Ps2_5699 [Pseudonocardia sp. Ae331_Ps2]
MSPGTPAATPPRIHRVRGRGVPGSRCPGVPVSRCRGSITVRA